MKKILMVLTLCLATIGLAGCGAKNYTVNDIIREQEAIKKGFSPIESAYPEKGQAYLSKDNTIVVYYNNGVFNSAHLTAGTSAELISVNDNVYVTDSVHTAFKNNSECLVDNQPQPLDSEACGYAKSMDIDYHTFIKDNFKQIIK